MIRNMTDDYRPTSIQNQGRVYEIKPPPASVVIGYGAVVFSAYIAVMAMINFSDQWGMYLLLSLIIILPCLIFADIAVQGFKIGPDGIIRCGLFGRKTVIEWDQIKKIQLIRHSAGTREIVIYGGRKKIAFINEIVFLAWKGFWPGVLALLQEANDRNIPIKSDFLGVNAWFRSGGEYLPGGDEPDLGWDE